MEGRASTPGRIWAWPFVVVAACGSGAGVCPRPAASDTVLMRVEEHTRGGACKLVPAIGVTEVDVDSTLYLRVNEAAVARLARIRHRAAWHVRALVRTRAGEVALQVVNYDEEVPAQDARRHGLVELMRSPREQGDTIHLRASFARGAREAVGMAQSLRVVRAGLRVDMGLALLFVQPFDRTRGVEPFVATPGIAATVHYRSWRASSRVAGHRVWNFIDPGIGVHLAHPDLGAAERDATGRAIARDPAIELGLGATLHLFGDVVQVGAGYDLQAEASYWFVGLGLQRLAGFGASFSPGGG